uniref:Dynein_C domain-containing protein n=1 Tax=Glossina austeni TaxID=7395 RepID=A0A1A9VT39_GLOAU
MKRHLLDVQRGIKYLVVMSTELENIYQSIFDGRVSLTWFKVYASEKPLAARYRDLIFQNRIVCSVGQNLTSTHIVLVGRYLLMTQAQKNNKSEELYADIRYQRRLKEGPIEKLLREASISVFCNTDFYDTENGIREHKIKAICPLECLIDGDNRFCELFQSVMVKPILFI